MEFASQRRDLSCEDLRMRYLLISVMLACISGRLFAWAPLEPDVNQQAMIWGNAPVDHLLPLRGHMWTGKLFELPYQYMAAFAVVPSFQSSYVMYLQKVGADYFVTVKAAGKDDQVLMVGREPLSKATADDVYWIWANVLLDVHYTRSPVIGCDGTTYFFASWIRGLGDLQGHVWEPSGSSPPKWISDAGEYLVEYVRNPKRNSAECQIYFGELRKRLQSYYTKRSK